MVTKSESKVFLFEGEKCAEKARELGFSSTTTIGGSGGWSKVYARFFSNKKVLCFPDNDEAGYKYISKAIPDLLEQNSEVYLVKLPDLPPGGDIVDFILNGGTKDRIETAISFAIKITSSLELDNLNPFIKDIEEDLLQVRTTLKVSTAELHQPFFRELPVGKEFPVQALGGELTEATLALHQAIQSPMALSAQSVLAAVALTVQQFCDVEVDGRRYPTSLFFLTIADSGERKTANDKIVLKPHRNHEENLITIYSQNKRDYEKLLSEWEYNERKRINSSPRKTNAEKIDFEEKPIAPLTPQIISNEPTFEGIFKSLEFGQPSMGIFSDEGGRFVGGHGLNNDNLLKMCAGLSGLWDGSPITKTRSGEGCSTLTGRRLSMHLMMQPIVANTILSNPIMKEQGLLNRCLITMPSSTIGTRTYVEVDPSINSAVKSYQEKITKLWRQKARLKSKTNNELNPSVLSLSKVAKAKWVEYYNDNERKLAKDKELGQIAGYGSKLPEQVIRIAGCLSYYFDPDSIVINEKYVSSAIEIADYYASEYLRLNESALIDPNLIQAQKLWDWISKRKIKLIYLMPIYQGGPGSLRSKAVAKQAVLILEEHGYVYKLESQRVDGAMRSEVWGVYEKKE